MEGKELQATKEQLAYAQLLDIGMKIGLALIVVTFAIYALGIMEPNIAVDDLPNYWDLSAEEYVEVSAELAEKDHVTGWGWTSILDKGDYLNFVGIAFLAGISIICYIRIVPILIGKKDAVYTIICLVEIAVLALAASGVLKVGGH